jgi:spectinomycin phosphotransferase
MLEKPNLPDEAIIIALRTHYDLPVASVQFLPLGNDATAWVYYVRTSDKCAYFLKVKKGAIYEPSVRIPHYLKAKGIEQVVAPLLTTSKALWVGLDSFALILYPFIEGPTGMEAGLSDDQWREFGGALRRIHHTNLTRKLMKLVERETFIPKWAAMVRTLDHNEARANHDDPYNQELAAVWAERREEILRIVGRCEALGQTLRQQSRLFVPCHTDIHTANILLDSAGKLHIVDWDTPLLAPVERDLMFIRDSVTVQTRIETCFFEGYGEVTIDPVALAYYRYEWVVQEIGDYGERVFLADSGAETKADSVRGFRQLFAPGDVVDVAYACEAAVPPGV